MESKTRVHFVPNLNKKFNERVMTFRIKFVLREP